MTATGINPQSFAFGADYIASEQIGAGATGQVFKGINRTSGTSVAIKFLRDDYLDNPQVITRFIAERKLLTSVKHPNLLEIIDLIADGGRLGIVMEYVPGVSLRQLLQQESTLPVELALEISSQILQALESIHQAGIIHRDIKPENILISHVEQPENLQIKLADFGIATLLDDSGKSRTQIIGTPAYLAPEYIQNSVVSPQVDVYALGISLYEMLAGSSPFLIGTGPKNAYTLGMDHIHTAVPPIPGLEPKVWELVSGMLEKQPDNRLQVSEALNRITPMLSNGLGGMRLAKMEAVTYHQETIVRPIAELDTAGPGDVHPEDGETETRIPTFENLPSIKVANEATVIRNLSAEFTGIDAKHADEKETSKRFSKLKNIAGNPFHWPVLVGIVATTVILLGTVLVWWYWNELPFNQSNKNTVEKIEARIDEKQTPAGLVISRNGVWDPQKQIIEYSVEYRTVKGSLTGNVLEVLQDAKGQCIEAVWESSSAVKPHSQALTSLKTNCGFEISLPQINATKEFVTKAQIPYAGAFENSEELKTWLKIQQEATNKVLLDSNAISTAYPLQRLQNISISSLPRVKQGEVVAVTVIGIWPSGEIAETPILISPISGKPTSILQEITGSDLEAFRFTDRCAGALAISADGHAVSALHPAKCAFGVSIGNFEANEVPISIVGSGS